MKISAVRLRGCFVTRLSRCQQSRWGKPQLFATDVSTAAASTHTPEPRATVVVEHILQLHSFTPPCQKSQPDSSPLAQRLRFVRLSLHDTVDSGSLGGRSICPTGRGGARR